jgi:hypothetical protein
MWDLNSGQHLPHRKRLRPPPPSWPAALNFAAALPECIENAKLGFGKHRGRTFRDVFHSYPDYCSWILNEAKRNPTRCSAEFVAFATYLRDDGSQHQYDRRQPEDRFWRRSKDKQGSCAETLYDDDSTDLASGQWKVTFGEKHVGLSFAEVLAMDADYCDFVIGQVLHSTIPHAAWIDSKVLSFVAYVQHTRLRAVGQHELDTFVANWGLDAKAQQRLLQLDASTQRRVIDGFSPKDVSRGASAAFMRFANISSGGRREPEHHRQRRLLHAQ